jgi:hypothetical protein
MGAFVWQEKCMDLRPVSDGVRMLWAVPGSTRSLHAPIVTFFWIGKESVA